MMNAQEKGEEVREERRNPGSNRGRELLGIIPTLTHQLNNSLAAIVGCAELCLLQPDNTGAVQGRLEKILGATRRIQGINQLIVDLTREIMCPLGTVKVGALIEMGIAACRGLISREGIAVQIMVDPGELNVPGTKSALQRVFTNLILNAVEAMEGRPEKLLKIRAEKEESTSMIRVTIEDTGCGISENRLEEAFQPHYTSKPDGMGLGLCVAREILGGHGGSLSLKSVLGRGTVVELRLPAHRPDCHRG